MQTNLPILTVENGRPMADSRDVATFFDKRHTHVIAAIRDLHCSPAFREPNFRPFKTKDLTGEHTSHVLMTKDGFMFLAMGFTGPAAGMLKEGYIVRFNEMEAELQTAQLAPNEPCLPQTYIEALEAHLEQAKVNAAQAERIALLEPRSEALAVLSDAEGSVCVTDAAKALGMPPGELWAYLYSAQWVYRRDRDGAPTAYQSKITAGYLTHKVVPVDTGAHRKWMKAQVRVTPKGLTALAQRIPLDKPGGLFGPRANPLALPAPARA